MEVSMEVDGSFHGSKLKKQIVWKQRELQQHNTSYEQTNEKKNKVEQPKELKLNKKAQKLQRGDSHHCYVPTELSAPPFTQNIDRDSPGGRMVFHTRKIKALRTGGNPKQGRQNISLEENAS